MTTQEKNPRVPVVAQQKLDLTSIYEDTGLIPGLDQLRSGIAVSCGIVADEAQI